MVATIPVWEMRGSWLELRQWTSKQCPANKVNGRSCNGKIPVAGSTTWTKLDYCLPSKHDNHCCSEKIDHHRQVFWWDVWHNMICLNHPPGWWAWLGDFSMIKQPKESQESQESQGFNDEIPKQISRISGISGINWINIYHYRPSDPSHGTTMEPQVSTPHRPRSPVQGARSQGPSPAWPGSCFRDCCWLICIISLMTKNVWP